jgi:hypothetical protein
MVFDYLFNTFGVYWSLCLDPLLISFHVLENVDLHWFGANEQIIYIMQRDTVEGVWQEIICILAGDIG